MGSTNLSQAVVDKGATTLQMGRACRLSIHGGTQQPSREKAIEFWPGEHAVAKQREKRVAYPKVLR